jgi:OOP family OmpA-OmpF porin
MGAQLDMIGDIEFETGSATIRNTPQNATVLNVLLQAGMRYTMINRLRIEGHTDSAGSDATNIPLSQARAEAVKSWLVTHGIAPERLVAVGCASRDPLFPNDTAEHMARNRRTEFDIEQVNGARIDGYTEPCAPNPSRHIR